MRATAALLVLLAGCGRAPPPAADGFRLPASTLGTPTLVIRLDRSGRITVDGRPRTLAQVEKTAGADDGPIRIEADPRVSMLPLALLWGAVGPADFFRDPDRPILLALDSPRGSTVLRLSNTLPWRVQPPVSDLDEAVRRMTVRFEVVVDPKSGTARELRIGEDGPSVPPGDEFIRLARAAGDEACVSGASWGGHPLAAVTLDSRLTLQGWLRVVEELEAAGFSRVFWPWAFAHSWTAAQDPIPLPDEPYRLIADFQGEWDLVQSECAPLRLPFSRTAVPDRGDDSDDRVILNVDEKGELLFKGRSTDLDELRAVLESQKRYYHAKMAAEGRSGYMGRPDGTKGTRLFALLRADRGTRWRVVDRILWILRETGYERLQLAAAFEADLRHSPEEAASAGVPWHSRLPTPWSLDGKVPFRLPQEPWNSEEWTRGEGPPIRVDHDAEGRVRYRGPDWEAPDSATLRAALARTPPAGGVGLVVAPDVTVSEVVALLDALREAGHADFVFVPGPVPEAGERR